jgi:hypothetical protein
MPLYRRREEPGAAEQFAELDRLGFFRFVEPELREEVEREARRRPSRAVFGERARRFFFADAESLAEAGVVDFLLELEPLLQWLGVPPLELDEELDPDGPEEYAVVVNGRRYLVYAEAEADRAWGLASARTLRILNDLLAAAGSEERAWAYQGGNELGVWILTPALRDVVAAIVDSPRDEPYEMTEEHPWYGERH